MRLFGMTVLIFILLALSPLFVVSYAEEPFVYQRSGRDPFLPWVTNEGKLIQGEGGFSSLEDVVLEGIIWDEKGASFAMMSGRILRKGDRIGRFEVLAIGKENVTLKAGEETYTLRLEKPEVGEEMP